MKRLGKRVICMLCTVIMLVTMMAPTQFSVWAVEATAETVETIEGEVLVSLTADDFMVAYAQDSVEVDSDSAYGKAAVFSYAKRVGDTTLQNAMIFGNGKNMELYLISGDEKKVGEITFETLQANQGSGEYALYKFTGVDLITKVGNDNFIYPFACWGLQFKLNDYAEALLGKNVDIYMSMKIEGNVSDTTDNTPTYYIDRVVITSEEDKIEPGTELASFLADDFTLPYASSGNGDCVMEDTDSEYGKAAVISYAKRAAYGDTGMMNATIFAGTESLSMYMIPGTEHLVGAVTLDEMRANAAGGEYVTYKFEGVELNPQDGQNNFLYLFDCWGFQIPLNDYISALQGQTVDVYLSMKITGDVSDNQNNMPTYYIDRVWITTTAAGETHTHVYGEWTYVDAENHSRSCSGCTTEVQTEAHSWDEGVVTQPPSAGAQGEKLFTCPVCKGTKTEKFSEEQKNIDLVFTSNDFTLPYGDPVVADTDSSVGTAAKFSYDLRYATGDSGLYNALIRSSVHKLELRTVHGTGAEDNTLIGQMTVDTLNANSAAGGYVTYKFEDVVLLPTVGNDNFIYMFDCWGFQIKLNAHKDLLQGEKVDLYLSMKVTGDVTNTTDNTPTYYIDQVAIKSPVDEELPENPPVNPPEGEDPPAEDEKTLPVTFTSDDFTLPYGDPVVTDTDSSVGTAAKFSYDLRYATGDSGLYKALIRSSVHKLELRTVHGTGANDNTLVGQMTVETLNANSAAGGYVTYKFEDVVLLPTVSSNNFIYLFDCWGFQINLNEYKDLLQGKKVDVYLSMKVTGDVTSTAGNTPTYYIDWVTIAEESSNLAVHQHTYGNWTYDATNHTGTCSGCGDTKTEAHDWNNGVVTKRPTDKTEGERLYTCNTCKATKIEKFKAEQKVIDITLTADDFKLPYAESGNGDCIMNDSTSSVGKAAVISYAKRAAYGDEGMMNAVIFGGEESLKMYMIPDPGEAVGELILSELRANAADGKYKLYKFKGVDLLPTADANNFLYLFDCWGFQVPLNEYAQLLEGAIVDVYLSMKITGNVSGGDNAPVYYIDKIMIKNTSSEGDQYIPAAGTASAPETDTAATNLQAEFPLTFTADDFSLPYAAMGNGDAIVSDSDSSVGKAAVLSYEKRAAFGDTGMKNAMIFSGARTLQMYMVPNSGEPIGEITIAQLLENAQGGEYVTYEFKNVDILPEAGKDNFIYLFDCWGFQIKLNDYVDMLLGQKVDVSLSLKVTGNVSSTGADAPTYYIDKVVIAPATEVEPHQHTCTEWTADEVNHTGTCSECGEVVTEAHVWDNGMVTKQPSETADGEKLFTCSVCGSTKTQKLDRIAAEHDVDIAPASPEKNPLAIALWITLGVLVVSAAVAVIVVVYKKKGKF